MFDFQISANRWQPPAWPLWGSLIILVIFTFMHIFGLVPK